MAKNKKEDTFSMPYFGVGEFYTRVDKKELNVPNSVLFPIDGPLEWKYLKYENKVHYAVWSDGALDTSDNQLVFECQKIIEENKPILSNLGVTDRILPGMNSIESAWATIYKALTDIDAIIIDMPESPSPLIDAAR